MTYRRDDRYLHPNRDDRPNPMFDPTLLAEGYEKLAKEGQFVPPLNAAKPPPEPCSCASCRRERHEADVKAAEAELEAAEAKAGGPIEAWLDDVAKSEADQRAEEILAAGQRQPPAWDPLGAAPFAWDLPEPKTPAPKKSRRQRVADWPSNGGLSLTYFTCALIWYALLVMQIVTNGPGLLMALDAIAGSCWMGAAVMTRKTERLRRERKAEIAKRQAERAADDLRPGWMV